MQTLPKRSDMPQEFTRDLESATAAEPLWETESQAGRGRGATGEGWVVVDGLPLVWGLWVSYEESNASIGG